MEAVGCTPEGPGPHTQHEDTIQEDQGDSRLESGLYPLGPGLPLKVLGMGVVRSETS